MASQDWNSVVLHSKPATRKDPPGIKGAPTEKKYAAGSNTKPGDSNMGKLDADMDTLSHKKVGVGIGKAIQQARTKQGMNQASLARSINERPAVVNSYENGKAIPNGQIIAKMERALGVKLPRPKK